MKCSVCGCDDDRIAFYGNGKHEAIEQCLDSIKNKNDQLIKVIGWCFEWIDSIPPDIVLPVMPGFDRDYVNNLIDT